MTVVCRPHLSSLARIVSVLHARRAPITSLRYATDRTSSRLVIDVERGSSDVLAAQLRRLVDVVSVDVVRVVAVAS